MSAPRKFADGRIVGGYSIHAAEMPELCPMPAGHAGAQWRVVDCCELEPNRDIVECSRCGKQRFVPCNFDEDFA